MELKEDSWKIIDAPKLPDWIMEAEKKLEYAILENMRVAEKEIFQNYKG